MLAGAWASSLWGMAFSSPWYPLCSRSPTFHQLNSVCISLSFLGLPATVHFSTSREATFPVFPLSILFKEASQTNVCKISSPGRGLSSGETVTWVHKEPDPGAKIHSRHTEEKENTYSNLKHTWGKSVFLKIHWVEGDTDTSLWPPHAHTLACHLPFYTPTHTRMLSHLKFPPHCLPSKTQYFIQFNQSSANLTLDRSLVSVKSFSLLNCFCYTGRLFQASPGSLHPSPLPGPQHQHQSLPPVAAIHLTTPFSYALFRF